MLTFTSKEKFRRGSTIIIPGVLSEDGVVIAKRRVFLSAVDVMRIYEDDTMTGPQKIAALRAMIVNQIQQWRLAEAKDALAILNDNFTQFSISFERAPLPELGEPPAEPEGGEPVSFAAAATTPEPEPTETPNIIKRATDWFRGRIHL